MTKLCFTLSAMLVTSMASAFGQEPGVAATPAAKPEPTPATYLITGLHCPPCTTTVESSLKKAKGISEIKVDWKSKTAHIAVDEAALSVQHVARLIAATPHMMGGGIHYAGWLALKAPEIKDEASGSRAEKALLAVEGVKSAKSYPAQHSVAVMFAEKGDVTSRQLIEGLKAGGFEAKLY